MKKMKALVIDDEQIVLDSVKKVLSSENFDVDTALRARTGLDLALRNPYDIVLADVRMPEMDGLTVMRDVLSAKPSMPVVIITGHATVESALAAMKQGATDYLEKPFTPEELIARVRTAMKRSGETGSPAPSWSYRCSS